MQFINNIMVGVETPEMREAIRGELHHRSFAELFDVAVGSAMVRIEYLIMNCGLIVAGGTRSRRDS